MYPCMWAGIKLPWLVSLWRASTLNMLFFRLQNFLLWVIVDRFLEDLVFVAVKVIMPLSLVDGDHYHQLLPPVSFPFPNVNCKAWTVHIESTHCSAAVLVPRASHCRYLCLAPPMSHPALEQMAASETTVVVPDTAKVATPFQIKCTPMSSGSTPK